MKKLLLLLLLIPSFVSAAGLTLSQGGLGTTTVPANWVLIGSTSLRVTAAATSTLGLESPLTFSTGLSRIGNAVTCNTASASIFGCLSAADWTTFNAKQAAGNYITALTGDVTAAGPGSSAATLATVNSNVGSFTNSNITVNGKGLITAASSGFSYPFPAGATSSLVTFTGGILVTNATSTINNLTMVNATTTNATTTALSISGTASTSILRIDSLSNGGLALNTGKVYSAATTTFSTGLTYSAGNTTCDTASASVFGCLTSAFFSKFNSATTTFSNGLSYSAGVASLATISANSVLANNTSGSAIPTALATSSLFVWNGTGNVVRTTSAALVTPDLGTPSALVLTNATGLSVAGGGTGASTLTGLLQGNGTSAFTAVTGTAGQFPYYNGTNTLLATSTLFVSTASNVGIGTANPSAYKLQVTNTAAGVNDLVGVEYGSATNNAGGYAFHSFGTEVGAIRQQRVGTGDYSLRFLNWSGSALAEYMTIRTGGNVGIGTLAAATGNHLCYDTTSISGMNTFATCSSLRKLKTNIKPFAITSDLLKLNPVSFTDKASKENRYGFIAEEVNAVNPILSTYYKGKLNGVDYDGVVSLLVKTVQGIFARLDGTEKAIQDQQTQIDELNDRLKKLEK
jgi:hypothetical protein